MHTQATGPSVAIYCIVLRRQIAARVAQRLRQGQTNDQIAHHLRQGRLDDWIARIKSHLSQGGSVRVKGH